MGFLNIGKECDRGFEEDAIAHNAWNLAITAAADAIYISGDSAGCSIAESCVRQICRNEIEALKK